ncbi:Na(+)-translocating NADH-quinone reductase subunit C [Moraxella nasovis]|uniref:Na(+)-translocating NADH-quinone reductase subunit C n=1 Tax=Moraxella nasovis TaxID=2904121 RepID=UPI001F60AC3A|nr:Na(+)-translocating NADH-quinone reductase subunit C [Moraxella nasovis]UNU73791.1 Na(+)-translocating NADH-quinone reductase subunit C [Moraxella nasovis]
MSAKNSNASTIMTALVLCLVCSVMVAAVAVGLKPKQNENALLDLNKNVLVAAGQFDPATDTNAVVVDRIKDFEIKLIDMQTGEFISDDVIQAQGINVETYDMGKASKTPSMSSTLTNDIVRIGRVPKYGKVYIQRAADGSPKLIVMPFYGYGLWGTIYGLVTLEGDMNTIKGVSFYQHKETPGLGALIEEDWWRDTWVGKRVYNDQGQIITGITKAGNSRENYIDGISGATLTGRGVNNMIQFWLGEDGYKPFLDNLRQKYGKGA